MNSRWWEVIERAIVEEVKRMTNEEFERGVQRGKLEQRMTDKVELLGLQAQYMAMTRRAERAEACQLKLCDVLDALLPWAEKMGSMAGSKRAEDWSISQEVHWLNEYAKEGRSVLSDAQLSAKLSAEDFKEDS